MSASRRVRSRLVPAGEQARRDRIAQRKMDALFSDPAIRKEHLDLVHAMGRIRSARHVVRDDTDPDGEDAAAPRIDPLS